jgi:hypothetical protein
MTLTQGQKLAIKELAEQVIGTAHPSELVLVKHIDFDRVQRSGDGILGFDAGAAVHLAS